MPLAVHGRHDPRRPRSEVEPSLEGSERLEVDQRVRFVQLDDVGARTGPRHLQLVPVATMAELDHPADIGDGSRATPPSRGEEAGLINGTLVP